MQSIGTVREAKDYLAGRIEAEAKREGNPLTEVERKMLYFSETDWTLPGMLEINAEFEREYDGSEYERRIAGLIRNIEARHAEDEQEMNTWEQAVEKLSEGDNYLSIMLNPSFTPEGESLRPPHDRLKLWLTAFAVVFGFLGFMMLLNWLSGHGFRMAGWLLDRGGLKFLVAVAVLAWAFRSKLRGVLNVFLDRK